MQAPTREELLAGLEDAELVLARASTGTTPTSRTALLGEVVARLGGRALPRDAAASACWSRSGSRGRGLEPRRALSRSGYFVEPYSDGVRAEPDLEMTETTAALGQLWSTAGDLARWGAFLAAGDDGVLAKGDAGRDGARRRVMADEERWTTAWGLGLGLYRRGDRVFAGHGGAMPGFLARCSCNRPTATGAVVLANSSAGAEVDGLGARSRRGGARARCRRSRPPGRPDDGVPDEVDPLLGRWWTEGGELVFSPGATGACARSSSARRRGTATRPSSPRRRPLALRRGARAGRAAPRRA